MTLSLTETLFRDSIFKVSLRGTKRRSNPVARDCFASLAMTLIRTAMIITMDKREIVKYWIKSSDNDYEAMDYLFRGKNYPWSLFVGHIVVEKLLKAHYTKNIDANTPYIHDLLRIADKAKL